MKNRRFSARLIVLVLALTMLPIMALPVKAVPAAETYSHPKSFTETAGVRALVDFKMIYVEGGTYTLGWQIDEEHSAPPHSPLDTAPVEATVSDFYIAETETTQQLYAAVMGNAPSASQLPQNTVSFYDVQRFLARLYVLTGKVYRLATEAEWEFAAKGGNPGKALGHHDYLYSGSNIESKVAVTGTAARAVKSLEPNILGIYDMSGNIEEWVWNPWNSNIVGGQDPIGVNSPVHAQRTRRGGAYQGEPYSRYAAARQIRSIDGGDPLLGFRIALSADQQSCPWEGAGLPKPFDIRHPVIDDRYEPNTYRDQRLVTNGENVWDGDFVGIFGGATMKLWDTGEAVIIPHNVDGADPTPIIGQWYTTLNVALVIVPEEDRDEWQINPHDKVKRLTVTYTFMEPDMISVQNDRTSVFMAPFGKLSRKNEAQYAAGVTDPAGPHGGKYSIIQKPTLKQELVATENLTAGKGPVAVNHLMWDMTQMNNYGNIETDARGKDLRLIDGPDNCWWMGYGAGGEHTYRKDFDLDAFRFGVYSPAFGATTQTPYGPQYFMNYIARGEWYTVNDLLLVLLNSAGTPAQHYIYLVAPDMQWVERNAAQPDGTNTYTKDNAESTTGKYVYARSPLMSPVSYPLRHLSLQTQERGDQRLFFLWPTHEAQFYPDEIPTGVSSIFGSTFRTPIDPPQACPGIPVLNESGGATGTWTTCGRSVYECNCPIYPFTRDHEETITKVELEFPVPAFGKTNNADARDVTIFTPGVAATTTTTPFNPNVAANSTANPSGGAFARNTNYTVTMTLIAQTGYVFPATGLAVDVNGLSATVSAAPTTGNLRARTITVVLNSGIGSNIVHNVNLTMEAPAAQRINDAAARTMTVSSISGTNPDVSATASTTTTPWTIAPATTSAVAANAAFDANTAYTLTFTLTPGATSAFPDTLGDLNVAVNGIPATVTAAAGTVPNGGVAPNRTVQVTFPPTGPATEVANVDIT
ncbi:MAG: formylglycine-generating enzyme family protein, partial [Oscillospiraceae bacterium]|nr:formylglycine-generating enzyme family protein [Oscillospiraceae bacterium]